jgi:hypothetical protein
MTPRRRPGIVALCAATLCFALTVVRTDAAEPSIVSAPAIDFGVALCTDFPQQKVDPATRAAVIRAIVPGARGKEVGFRVVGCEKVIGDATCFAEDRLLICRASAIERVLRTAAWVAKRYGEAQPISYDDFRTRIDRWNVAAVRYADGLTADGALDAALSKFKQSYAGYQSSGTSADASKLPPADLVYVATVDYVLAALVGHELSHVMGERCPLDQKARTEELGLVSLFMALHQSGELFCPRPPSLEEVRADVCGLRHVRAVTQSLASHRAVDRDAIFARRASADLVAFSMTFGWRPRSGAPAGKYPFMELQEYLYAPMRVLAFGAELILPTKGTVAVCGEAASLFVFGAQELFKSCPKANGIVSDEVLALLPPAVEAAWNGAKWTPSTFACVGR